MGSVMCHYTIFKCCKQIYALKVSQKYNLDDYLNKSYYKNPFLRWLHMQKMTFISKYTINPPDKTLQMLRFFMLPPRKSEYSAIYTLQRPRGQNLGLFQPPPFYKDTFAK